MSKIDDVLNVARGEIGYRALLDPEPGSKYARWLAEVTGEDWLTGPSTEIWWCCCFVSWVLAQCNVVCPGFPSYNTDLVLGKKPPTVDKWHMKPGDIVIWDWDGNDATDHIGFVERYDEDGLTTIEGNYRNSVARVNRTDTIGLIRAVIRPPYAGAGAVDGSQIVTRGIDIYNGSGAEGMQGNETAAQFVICKASEGVSFRDAYAAKFAANVTAAGKLLGFYHFARTNKAETEAEYFVSCVKATGYLASATLWLDYESTAVGNGPEWAERFMSRVDELTGKTCGIYISKSVANIQDWSASVHRPLWGAQYANDEPVHGWQDTPWQSSQDWGAWGSNLAIHQYTGNGYVAGWSGSLDLNRGYFTRDQWAQWAHHTIGDDDMTQAEHDMLQAVYDALVTPADASGRGKLSPAVDRLAWMAKKKETMQADIDKIKKAVGIK